MAIALERSDMIRVFTAFSGYDSQCLALNRANIDYELVGWSEIDKFAIKAHNALFPQWTDRNFGDISKIDWNQVPGFDLFTYSSPCQDFSNAGKMRGGEKGSGTRSSLLWECEKAIRAKMPKYLLMENVANLVSKKFIGTFQNWLNVLSELGYTNYCQVLNAKDYGVPQNRKRVFVVSILNSQEPYYFPKKTGTNLVLKDLLEKKVRKLYYLSKKIIKGFETHAARYGGRGHSFAWNPTDGNTIARTILASCGYRPSDNYIEIVGHTHKGQSGIVYGINGNSPTITTNKGDGQKIAVSKKIRKLTERECFRLMGVADADSNKIRQVVTKSRCYKLAGNSIVVDVLVAIFNQLFSENKTTDKQLKLF